MDSTEAILMVLQHDLHKLRITDARPHHGAMPDDHTRTIDGIAAWMGRNFLQEPFENSLYRKSLVLPLQNFSNPRTLINRHRVEVAALFKQTDAPRLHTAILRSKLLNLYREARQYPYSSLKYHILLTCALYYNTCQNYRLKELYLCENQPVDSPFQIFYQDTERTWALLPNRATTGLSRLWAKFYHSWDYRRHLSIGGDHRILAGILSSIESWTTALATIEDYQDLLKHD